MAKKMPAVWAGKFSNSILNVTNALGVKVVGEYSPNEDCIRIRIVGGTPYNIPIDSGGNLVISGRFSQDSYKNINIIGIDYHGEIKDFPDFTILTWVGYRNKYYNPILFPKMLKREKKNDPLAVSKYCSTRSDVCFKRKHRYTRTHYRDSGTYNSLIKFLNDVINSGICGPGMFDLEVLEVATATPLSLKKIIIDNDQTEIKKLEDIIEKLMILLDWIYQH